MKKLQVKGIQLESTDSTDMLEVRSGGMGNIHFAFFKNGARLPTNHVVYMPHSNNLQDICETVACWSENHGTPEDVKMFIETIHIPNPDEDFGSSISINNLIM